MFYCPTLQNSQDFQSKIPKIFNFEVIFPFYSSPTFYKEKFGYEQRLLGLELSETPLAEYVNVSPDSTYLVWVYSNRCSRCINSIENIKEYQTGVADCFVALDVKNDSNNTRRKLLNITFPSKYIGKKPEGFIRSLPTLFYIEKGKIKHVIEGVVPNVYYFKKRYLGMTDEEITLKRDERDEE